MPSKPLPRGTKPLDDRKTVKARFQEFADRIIQNAAPLVQKVEMRRAWYAGAEAMFGLITTYLDDDREPTELDIAYVDSLHQELLAFGKDLLEGRA